MANKYYALLDKHGDVIATLPCRRAARSGEHGYTDPRVPLQSSLGFIDLCVTVGQGDGLIAGSETMWDGLPPPWCHEICFVESNDPWPKGGPRPSSKGGLRGVVTLWKRVSNGN